MNENTLAFAELQDHHLNMMIKLAFDQEDAEEIQQILDETDTIDLPLDDNVVKHAWLHAQAKMDAMDSAKHHAQYFSKLKRLAPRMIEVAACLILVVSIAMPIAIASSAEFRAKVMQLLISIDKEQQEAHFEFVENTAGAFSVPASWTGEYFISYLPKGMVENWHSAYIPAIEYCNEDDSVVSFSEHSDTTSIGVGIKNATTSYTNIHGNPAYVVDGYIQDSKTHMITIVWSNDEKWFTVECSNIEYAEALRIAKSVRKILK